jgi:3-oxoadipate CoA-transferase alpha subunit
MPSSLKFSSTVEEALGSVADGSRIIVGGFGDRGIPFALLDGLADLDVRHLTLVSINAGRGRTGIARLISEGRVEKMICCFPRTEGSIAFEEAFAAGRINLELVAMGTLVARLQAGAAGNAAFYTPVGAGTELAAGKEVRDFDGRAHILEFALRGDIGLVRAEHADPYGNLGYRGTDRNLNPLAARAADRAVAEVALIREGPLNPETVETPGLYMDRITAVQEPAL